MKIVIIVAMEKEDKHIIAKLRLEKAPADMQLPYYLHAPVFYKKINHHEIILVPAGKNRRHAVDSLGTGILPSLALALEKFKPDLVINAGSAGGLSSAGCQIGEVLICQGEVNFHDRRLEPDVAHVNYGVGHFPLSDFSTLANLLGLKSGRISTGSSLMASEADERQFIANQAILKDMEAAHVAQLCDNAEINLIIIKVVSDLIDTTECPQQQFSYNIVNVMDILAQQLERLLIAVMDKAAKNELDEEESLFKKPVNYSKSSG